jgi:hypothetical protein
MYTPVQLIYANKKHPHFTSKVITEKEEGTEDSWFQVSRKLGGSHRDSPNFRLFSCPHFMLLFNFC